MAKPTTPTAPASGQSSTATAEAPSALGKIRGEQAPRSRNAALHQKKPGIHHVIVENNPESLTGGVSMMETLMDEGYVIAEGQDESRHRVRLEIPEEDFQAREREHMNLARSRSRAKYFSDSSPEIKNVRDDVEELPRSDLAAAIETGRHEMGVDKREVKADEDKIGGGSGEESAEFGENHP